MSNTSFNQSLTPLLSTATEPITLSKGGSIKPFFKPSAMPGKAVRVVSDASPHVGKHQIQHEDILGVYLIQRICTGVGGMKHVAREVFEKIIQPYQLLQKGVPVSPQKGILLYGPPGTGKSLLASRIVQEMGVKSENAHFIKSAEVIARDPEPSVANLKKIFRPAMDAQKSSDGISEVFLFCFDEIDAMLQPKEEWQSPSKSQEAIRLELQSILSGPQSYDNIIIIGTTNIEPSRFDPALRRQGRFSVQISIPLPDRIHRYEILQVFCHKLEDNGWNCEDFNLNNLSWQTSGKSGADLEQLMNDAVVISVNEYEMAKQLPKSEQSEVVAKPKTLIDRHFLEALSNSSDIKLRKSKTLDKLAVAHPFTALLKHEQEIICPALKAINRVAVSTGRFGIIVVQGASKTGKTAICRQLVERAEGFDNFQAITEVKDDLTPNNMIKETKKALAEANNFRSSLIVIDNIDSLFGEKEIFEHAGEVPKIWGRLTGKIEGKNAVLLVTTSMDQKEFVEKVSLQDIREYVHLPETLTQGEIKELMVAWDVDQQVQKEVSHIFAEGCSVKQFHTLFEHYRNDPLEDGELVTWDTEGMKRDFQRGRNGAEQKNTNAHGMYS